MLSTNVIIIIQINIKPTHIHISTKRSIVEINKIFLLGQLDLNSKYLKISTQYSLQFALSQSSGTIAHFALSQSNDTIAHFALSQSNDTIAQFAISQSNHT